MSDTFKKMLSYYKPYMGIFLADMLFATLSAAVALIIPLVVRYVTSTLIYEPREVILQHTAYIAAGLLVLLIVDCYSRFFIGNYGHVMGAKIEYNMREEVFDHLQKLSFSFYDDAKVGQLMSRVTNDLFDITELLHHGPENIILSLLKIIGAFVILVSINVQLALAAFVILPIMFVFALVLNRRMRRASRRNREKIAEINAQIEDNLAGIRVVKSFANEQEENRKFSVGNQGFLAAKKNSYHYMGTFQAGVGFFTTLIQVSVIITGCVLIANGRLDIPDLVTFLLYISVFTEPITTLVNFTEQFQNGYTGFERFRELMDIEPDIEDSPNAVPLENVRGDIHFDNVSFHYKENAEDVLQHVSLDVPAGSYVALVGSSGAGKTFTLQCVGGRLRQQGKRIIYIIPKKGHEFRPRCEQLGGLYLRMSPSSPDCPNIMAIRRKSLDTYAGLKGLASRDDSVLADKISRLIIWYSLQKRDLSDEDRNYLDTSLVECYRQYGITFDNASVLNEDGSFCEMPVLADWYDVLQESADTRHLAVVLARYVTGSASAMGSRNEIDLDNKYIVIDTSGMPDDLLLPGIFWATDIANDLISGAGGQLSALISDELWSLVGANSNPLAAGYIQEMVKTIRGLGGIAITSTQGMQDLFSLDNGKYGKGILDSSRIKIVMQMEEQEARLIQNVLNLSEEEVRQITRFRRGEGLLCIGYNHVPIAFYATQKEYDAITTSPTDLLNRNAKNESRRE